MKCSGLVFCCRSVACSDAKVLDLDSGVQEEYVEAVLVWCSCQSFLFECERYPGVQILTTDRWICDLILGNEVENEVCQIAVRSGLQRLFMSDEITRSTTDVPV